MRFAAQSGKPDLWVHPLAAATRGLEGVELAELALMRDAGARAVATGRRWIGDSGVMLRLLRYCAMLDLVVVTHAEDAGADRQCGRDRGRDGDAARPARRAAPRPRRWPSRATSRWPNWPARGSTSGR